MNERLEGAQHQFPREQSIERGQRLRGIYGPWIRAISNTP